MGMGRRRDRSRAGWPDNLYPCKNGSKYRHPVTKKETWMGTDLARAKDAARKLNAILITSGSSLVNSVLGLDKTVADAVEVFRCEDVPHRDWAPATAALNEYRITRILRDMGSKAVDQVTVKDVADYLRAVTDSPRARQQFRLVMVWIFACALQEGWIESNPAEQTRKVKAPRQRVRLTLDGYKAIHARAPAWLQIAMDLSLQTLLRREDIVSLRRREDVRDGFLFVVPSKTEGSTNVRLKIPITPPLQAVLDRAADAVVSPFIVHRLPDKARPREMRAADRTHHTQVLPEQLTRAFADARDASGAFDGIESPPTFHEIRSLGGALYQDAGWTLHQVQALMGHASEAMTKHYLEGHEAPWIEVRAGLDVASIGRK